MLPRGTTRRPGAPAVFGTLFGTLLGAVAGVVFGVLGALAPARAARAQGVMIAPTAVVATDRARSAALTLVNTGEQEAEVRLSVAYGYPVTDTAGAMTLRLVDAPADTAPSAAGWVRFFPERLTLAPGQRRTVRLLVTPPPGLRDGEYWARVVVASRRAPSVVPSENAPIAVGLALEVRSVLGLFYRHGAVATAVRLDAPRARPAGDSLAVRARLTREGSAAFVGSLRAVLRDAAGAARAEAALPLGVYYELDPRLALPTGGLPAGDYTLAVEAVAARPDVPAASLLPAPPARRAVPVTLP